MLRIINVQFHADASNFKTRTYAYYTDDDSIEVGDTVVVDAPSSGLTCVKVMSTEETVESVERVQKWIVCKVDATAYRERMAKEERRKVILAKLRKAKERILAESEIDTLIAFDPSLAELAAELRTL